VELSRELAKKFGPAFPPSRLLALTPLELIALFTVERDANDLDAVAELHRVNHTVAAPKGRGPSAPSWLMPKVPRWRRAS
jgi:hypothetical protein